MRLRAFSILALCLSVAWYVAASPAAQVPNAPALSGAGDGCGCCSTSPQAMSGGGCTMACCAGKPAKKAATPGKSHSQDGSPSDSDSPPCSGTCNATPAAVATAIEPLVLPAHRPTAVQALSIVH